MGTYSNVLDVIEAFHGGIIASVRTFRGTIPLSIVPLPPVYNPHFPPPPTHPMFQALHLGSALASPLQPLSQHDPNTPLQLKVLSFLAKLFKFSYSSSTATFHHGQSRFSATVLPYLDKQWPCGRSGRDSEVATAASVTGLHRT